MTLSVGYACIALGTCDRGMRGCILKNASPERLDELVESNLQTLSRMLDYNAARGIKLFRISSDIIPFGSHPEVHYPWWDKHADHLAKLGDKIRAQDIRVSMHPGQYTVLNAMDEKIVERAVEDLEYHARFLDQLGLDARHKIILHVGGIYGDVEPSIMRFSKHYRDLSSQVKNRLVLENDEKYNIAQVLQLCEELQLPAVFDVFHHQCNPAPGEVDLYAWLDRSHPRWLAVDGVQKIHYSQQQPGLRSGAHSRSIQLQPFLDFYHQLPDRPLDIMLECKDKDISAIKCQQVVNPRLDIGFLEEEWARYKYLVMEHSQRYYRSIGKTLGARETLTAVPFYLMVEEALRQTPVQGDVLNAAQHVWGYFKKIATTKEKAGWLEIMKQYESGTIASKRLKNYLYRLAQKYGDKYLLQSYYFVL
jgi:UV DNA damage endonuclease